MRNPRAFLELKRGRAKHSCPFGVKDDKRRGGRGWRATLEMHPREGSVPLHIGVKQTIAEFDGNQRKEILLVFKLRNSKIPRHKIVTGGMRKPARRETKTSNCF